MQRAENREIYHGTTDETYTFGFSKDPDSKYRIYYLLSYLLNKSGNLFGDEMILFGRCCLAKNNIRVS